MITKQPASYCGSITYGDKKFFPARDGMTGEVLFVTRQDMAR